MPLPTYGFQEREKKKTASSALPALGPFLLARGLAHALAPRQLRRPSL
jgi:hypothetical protein